MGTHTYKVLVMHNVQHYTWVLNVNPLDSLSFLVVLPQFDNIPFKNLKPRR